MPRPPGRFFATSMITPDQNFPHMLPRERDLFRIWLNNVGQMFDGFMFDVRVGSGRPATLGDIEQYRTILRFPLALSKEEQERIDASIRLAWQSLTQKRIDALGFKGEETWLIEVKKVLNMSLIGQLDIYSILLVRDYPPDGPFVRAAVVRDVDPDVGPIAEERGILIFRV